MTPHCLNLYLHSRQVVTDDQENNTWSDVVLRVCDLMALGLLRISRSRLRPQASALSSHKNGAQCSLNPFKSRTSVGAHATTSFEVRFLTYQ